MVKAGKTRYIGISNCFAWLLTKAEIAAIVTHVAFYTGWPKAWTKHNMEV